MNPQWFDGPSAGLSSSAPFQRGLSLLVQAHRYAEELGRDTWDFAVELRLLNAAGLTTNDLRWLVCKGLVQHGCEVIESTVRGRAFQPIKSLMFSKRTCFVLTDDGLQLSRRVLEATSNMLVSQECSQGRIAIGGQPAEASGIAAGARLSDPRWNPRGNGAAAAQPPAPKWDDQRHEFFVGDNLVKVFRLPSPNQETILTAFEEDGWPARVDDPLPPAPDIDPKRRLHDTIRGLNRNQRNRLIYFMGDGTGEGIRWKLLP